MSTPVVPQSPRPPAAAYFVVSSLLSPSYFTCRPQQTGVHFTVTGTDNVATYWLIPDWAAPHFENQLRAHREIRSVRVESYDHRKRDAS